MTKKKYLEHQSYSVKRTEFQGKDTGTVMAKIFSLQRHCVVYVFKIIVYLYSTDNRKSQLGRE